MLIALNYYNLVWIYFLYIFVSHHKVSGLAMDSSVELGVPLVII